VAGRNSNNQRQSESFVRDRSQSVEAGYRHCIRNAVGLKLTPYADNAQFFGLTGSKAHFDTLFDTAFVIWRKKGLVTKTVDAKDYVDARFIQSLAANYPGQKVEEKPVVAQKPSEKDIPILHQQIQISLRPDLTK